VPLRPEPLDDERRYPVLVFDEKDPHRPRPFTRSVPATVTLFAAVAVRFVELRGHDLMVTVVRIVRAVAA